MLKSPEAESSGALQLSATLARKSAIQHCNPHLEVRNPAQVPVRELGRVAVPEEVVEPMLAAFSEAPRG
eukprot:4869020-Alexandrium_andersonii.AAC.1